MEMWVLWLFGWAGYLPGGTTSNGRRDLSHSSCSRYSCFQFRRLSSHLLCGYLWQHEHDNWGIQYSDALIFNIFNCVWHAGWRELPSTRSTPSATEEQQYEPISGRKNRPCVTLAVCSSCSGCAAASFAEGASEAEGLPHNIQLKSELCYLHVFCVTLCVQGDHNRWWWQKLLLYRSSKS